jgi:hypothetical protein
MLDPEFFNSFQGLDTFRIHFRITRFAQDGTSPWARRYTFDLYNNSVSGPFWDWQYSLFVRPEALYVSMSVDPHEFPTYQIIKLDPNGTLLWAKQYGNIYSLSPNPYWLDAGIITSSKPILADPTGYLYVLPVSTTNGNVLDRSILRIDPDGTPAWMRRYTYTNNAYFEEMQDILLDAAGNAMIIETLNVGSDQRWIMHKVAPNGERLWSILFVPPVPYVGSLALHPGPGINAIIGDDHLDFFEVDSAGEISHALSIRDTIIDPYLYEFKSITWRYLNGRLVVPGYLISEHQIFGDQTFQPQVWSANPGSPTGCLLGTPAISRYMVPDNLMQVTDLALFSTVDLELHSEEVTMNSSSRLPINTSDLCSMFVGLADIRPLTQISLSVLANVVLAGTSFQVSTHESAVFELISVTGELCYRSGLRQPGVSFLPTDFLGAGTYLLKATSGNDARTAVARVVVID